MKSPQAIAEDLQWKARPEGTRHEKIHPRYEATGSDRMYSAPWPMELSPW